MNRYAMVALAGSAVLAVGGGTALASKGGGDPTTRCQAFVAKIAARRGLTVAQLEANVKARLDARVDAALAAGRITAEHAAALKARIDSADLCTGAGRLERVGVRGFLARAADYLGLTRAELRQELPGTSLAALATTQGKSVDGLEAAMLAPVKDRLARAVTAGRLTQTQADTRLGRLTTLVDKLVNKTFPAKS